MRDEDKLTDSVLKKALEDNGYNWKTDIAWAFIEYKHTEYAGYEQAEYYAYSEFTLKVNYTQGDLEDFFFKLYDYNPLPLRESTVMLKDGSWLSVDEHLNFQWNDSNVPYVPYFCR